MTFYRLLTSNPRLFRQLPRRYNLSRYALALVNREPELHRIFMLPENPGGATSSNAMRREARVYKTQESCRRRVFGKKATVVSFEELVILTMYVLQNGNTSDENRFHAT